MLAPALADPDPVLIFEHGSLYALKGTVAVDAGPVDIDHAVVRRPGTDLSLIAYGGTLHKALEAADILSEDQISAEVVDSVRRTHSAVIVDEGWRSGSLSAEVTARIMDQAFYDLDAPVQRVCTAEVPLPFAKHLEDAALPQTEDIVAAARKVLR